MTERIRFLLVLGWFSIASLVLGQELPQDSSEAPEAIFDQKLGDVGVVLDAQGTWTSRLAAGWGEGFSPAGTLPSQGYPGYDNGPVFTQIPDFTLMLKLMDRYYVDVNFAGTYSDQTFEAGYIGRPGELVQWVKVGTAPFALPVRAGQTFSEGRRGDLGAGAAFTDGPVATEVALRYEDGVRETRTFQGFTDLSTSRVNPQSWIGNRFFRMPLGARSGVQILVADPTGSLNGYRVALSTEASYDSASGEIDLPTPATKRYLVTWTGAAPYTSSLLGITTIADTTPGSGTWYILTQPGYSSPFEIRNRYPMTKGTTGSILLYNDAATNLTPLTTWTVGYSPLQDWFSVGGTASAGEEAPFLDQFPGIYPSAISPTPARVPSTIDWSFHLPATSTATNYTLGQDVIPSTLAVTRNGVATTAYNFDPKSGILTFDVPIYDTDQVVISYERSKTGDAANNLGLWQAGRWDIDDDHNLEWAVQGQWNVSNQPYTTEDLQSPGQVEATAQWSGTSGEWDWQLAATGGARLTDSTGVRMLYGQSDAGVQASYDGDALRPSAAPDPLGSVLTSTYYGFGTSVALSESNRAKTYFRNFWSTDPVSGSLSLGSFANTSISRQSWTSGGWTGPYYVLGDGSRTDTLAVLDTDIGVSQWAGMEVFVDKGKTEDLSTATAITVTVRVQETLADVGNSSGLPAHLILEAGNVSRNFDGTGAVRSITYQTYPALSFYNQASGFSQFFPIPQGSVWGNDADGSGSAGSDAPLVMYDLSSSATTSPISTTSSGWQTITVNLSATDRQKLTGASGWRLVLVTPTTWSGVQTKTVLVGPVLFAGSTWTVASDSPSTGTVTPVEYADSTRTDGHDLQVTWANASGVTTPSTWTIQGRNTTMDPRGYQALSFRYQLVSSNSTTPTGTVPLTVFIGDGQGHGVTASWNAAVTSSWVTAKIGLQNNAMTIGGVAVSGATVSSAAGATAWDRVTVTKGSATGDYAGTMIIAEVEAVDPVWEPIASTKAEATWTQSKPWPSSDVPLVTGLKVGFQSNQDGIQADTFTWSGQSTVSGTFGLVRGQGEALYTYSPLGDTAHGAYQATLPLGWTGGPTLELFDQFSDQGLRAEKVTVGAPWVGTTFVSAKASGPPTTLSQEYRLGWDSPPQWYEGWKGSTLGSWDQTTPVVNTLDGFAQTWADSWSWLAPPGQIADYFQVQGHSEFSIAPSPVGFGAETTLKTVQSQGSYTVWTPTGTWLLRVPIRLHPEAPWTLTPSVSREVDVVYDLSSPVDPEDSSTQTLAELMTRGLVGVPFSEQLASASPWDGANSNIVSGSVISTAALDWERTPISDWTDLAVPLAGKVQYSTNQGLASGAEYLTMTTTTTLTGKGNNLFGTLGSSPFFTWYQSDVWGWSLDGSWGWGTRTADNITTAGIATQSTLSLSPVESVSLPVTFKGTWGPPISQTTTINNGSDWSDTLTLKPSWTFRGPANLPFDLPGWISARAYKRMFVQELSSTLDLGWPVSPEIRNLEIVWKGRFLLSPKSEFDLTTSWGQQWQVDLYQLGLEVAIDIILAF